MRGLPNAGQSAYRALKRQQHMAGNYALSCRRHDAPLIVDKELQKLGRRRLAPHAPPNTAVRRSLHCARPDVDATTHPDRPPLTRVVDGRVRDHLQQVLHQLIVLGGNPGTTERETQRQQQQQQQYDSSSTAVSKLSKLSKQKTCVAINRMPLPGARTRFGTPLGCWFDD